MSRLRIISEKLFEKYFIAYEWIKDFDNGKDISIDTKINDQLELKLIDNHLNESNKYYLSSNLAIKLSENDTIAFNKLFSKGIVRDKNLLSSAINNPFQTFDSKELYSTILEKAVQLFYSLVQNHPFIDGNKRTAIHSFLVFLKLNGFHFEFSNSDLFKLTMNMADNKLKPKHLLSWLINSI